MTDRAAAQEGPRPTLFGKLPSTLDFVRVNHVTSEAIALDQWIQAALQHLAQRGASWPSHRIRFVFRAPASALRVVGVIAPSRDRAGRKFPVALFAPVPSHTRRNSSAACALGAGRFLEEAELLLETLVTLDREQCAERLEALSVPLQPEIEQAHSDMEAELSHATANGFFTKLFTPDTSIGTAQQALSVVDSLRVFFADYTTRPLVLDCPVRRPLDAATWMALVELVEAPLDGPPSMFWSTEEPCQRSLISLSVPPSTIPLWLMEPRSRSEKLRPMFAPVSSAQPAASGALSADLTLRQLFDSVVEALRNPS